MAGEISNLPAGSCLQAGKYKIIKVLGQGGFGITYLAEQTGLGMKVAIKEFFLKGSCQRDSATSEISIPVTDNRDLVAKCQKKFKSEARKIASLNNDHIVNIIDIFDENGTSYYVMKYLSGGSLADKVQAGPLPEKRALKVIEEVSEALDSIHSHGLLHLDIKPANILFDERDRAVLIDFGVSKYVDSQDDTTTTSSLVGFSRGFAPLEQVNATITSLTPATDLYALGATLYNLVVGTTPPEAPQVMDGGLPEMPSSISEEVKYAITQSMQPRKKDRPQNVRAFLDLLPALVEKPQVEEETVIGPAQELDSTDSTPPSSPRVKLFLIASAVMLLFAIILFGWTMMRPGKTKEKVVMVQNSGTRALTSENESLKKQVEELKKKEATLSQNNQSMKKQLDALKRQVSSSSQDNASQVAQITNLQKEKDNQAAQISALKKENESLKQQVNSYKPDADRWRRQMEVNK